MKGFFFFIVKMIGKGIGAIIAFLLQFWWLFLILFIRAAYCAAAKEWGWLAGIVSVIAAFVLPIITIVLWMAVIGGDDTKVDSENKTRRVKDNELNKNQSAYLRLLAAMMAKIAKADGHIDESEICSAEKAFDRLGFSDIQKQLCILAFRNALNEPHSADYYAAEMVRLDYSYEMRLIAYEILWDVACADKVLTPEERNVLRKLERVLKLNQGTFNKFFTERIASQTNNSRANYWWEKSSSQSNPLEDEYDELGCKPTATDDELKVAYRTLAKKYHPDILRAQGMPESLMGKANERMARINTAWEKIKKARGIKN